MMFNVGVILFGLVWVQLQLVGAHFVYKGNFDVVYAVLQNCALEYIDAYDTRVINECYCAINVLCALMLYV